MRTSLCLFSTPHEFAQQRQQKLSAHADISQQKRADNPPPPSLAPPPLYSLVSQIVHVNIDPREGSLIILVGRCVLLFPLQTLYIFMKSEPRVSEGKVCCVIWGTKHHWRFLSFVRICGVSQVRNLKNCNYSIIYVKRINLSKQIGMCRGRLCEGVKSFYWETSKRGLGAPCFCTYCRGELLHMCFLCFFPTNVTDDGNRLMRYITVWIII
jgi:hypothetical protein